MPSATAPFERTSSSASTYFRSSSRHCASGWRIYPRWLRTWPGNIRELANLVERLSILCGPVIEATDVRGVLPGGTPVHRPSSASPPPGRSLADLLDEYERELLCAALAQAQGNMAEAARMLQTDRANLYRRMRRLGVEKSADVEV